MLVALQAGITPNFTRQQELQLLVVGLGLVFVLLVDRFIFRRLIRRFFRAIGQLPLLDVFVEKDLVLSRWVEVLIGLLFLSIAVVVSLNIAGVDVSVVTAWAKGVGDGILAWFWDKGIRILLILVLAYLVNRAVLAMLVPVIRSAATRGKSGTALDEANKRSLALTQVARHAARITIVVIAGLMVLGVFDYNIGPVLAGLGVVGIAVGFGAQHTVRDIIAGAFIIAEDQYRVGDVASVAGKTGVVQALNLRRTVLRDLDGVVHFIPNGEILTASNLTKDFSRVNLNVTVAYHEDLDRVIRILNRVGAEIARDGYFGDLILEAPRVTRIDNFSESGIEIKVLGVTKPIRQWEVAGELRRRIKREFDREGIEMGIPRRGISWGPNAHPALDPDQIPTFQRPGRPYTRRDGDASLAMDPWAREQEAQERAVEEEMSLALSANYARVKETVLAHGPMALFVDIDGTLARINPNPNAVSITPALRQALNTLSRHVHVVALTGRQVSSAKEILGLNSITYVGNHGIEWWERGTTEIVPEAEPYLPRMSDIVRIAKRRLRNVDGLLVEDKGPTLSFHYRSSLDPEVSRRAILNFLSVLPEARGLDIREGKMVVEVRPPVHLDKGSAVRRIVERRGIFSAIAMGDDTTDIDTFDAIRGLRESIGLHALCIAVLGEYTPQELIERADLRANDVEDVELFIEWLADEVHELHGRR